MPPTSFRYVSADVLRERFNTLRFWERRQAGDLQGTVIRDRHLRAGTHPFPQCTCTQMEVYYDVARNPVAKVHQYRLPSGALGSSGLPDPKWIVVGDEQLALKETP